MFCPHQSAKEANIKAACQLLFRAWTFPSPVWVTGNALPPDVPPLSVLTRISMWVAVEPNVYQSADTLLRVAQWLTMEQGRGEALICWTPEFYGPGKTQCIANATVIDNLLVRKKARMLL